MSRARQDLIRAQYEVVESSTLLREQLQQYEKSMLRIARRLEKGEPAISAGYGTGVPKHRRQVTEAIDEFEGSRRQLRLALFAVGKEEGESIAAIGRILGISRQLASRLAAGATSTDP
ncbi:MAG: hypothetical protein ACLP9C_05340 [Acidimicrobiales bacterium]